MGDGGTFTLVFALAAALAMLSLAALRGWEGWLQVRRLEVAQGRGRGRRPGPNPAAARLELADLKDRVRRLEAIANGLES